MHRAATGANDVVAIGAMDKSEELDAAIPGNVDAYWPYGLVRP